VKGNLGVANHAEHDQVVVQAAEVVHAFPPLSSPLVVETTCYEGPRLLIIARDTMWMGKQHWVDGKETTLFRSSKHFCEPDSQLLRG
jgi:hypothetical protein